MVRGQDFMMDLKDKLTFLTSVINDGRNMGPSSFITPFSLNIFNLIIFTNIKLQEKKKNSEFKLLNFDIYIH